MNWTKEEEVILREKGFRPFSNMTTSVGNLTIEKNILYNKIKYKAGVEGTAYDCDGDLGWCRTWSTYDILEELFKKHKIK